MRRVLAAVLAAALAALGLGCGAGSGPVFTAQEPPDVRVGLMVAAGEVSFGCGAGFTVSDDRGVLAAVPRGGLLRAVRTGDIIHIYQGPKELVRGRGPYRFAPDNKALPFQLEGKSYPGLLVIRRNSLSGLNAVNVVDVETYLRGVLPKEIPSAGPYQQAARAQAVAVAARSYALSKLGQFPKEGFDLYSGVLDQVYGSIDTRNPTADAAVLATRGQVLLYKGRPIEAKYNSTCGGRMAALNESFHVKAPYLPAGRCQLGGRDACRNSKYYRWKETWTRDAFWRMLEGSVPDTQGRPLEGSRLRRIEVTERGDSGRAVTLRLETDAAEYTFSKAEIRRVLRRSDGGMLRSTAFDIDVNWRGSDIHRVIIEGRGWGHGVGMCQWGAMAFSAAGKDYSAILRHYYPKTQLERVYE